MINIKAILSLNLTGHPEETSSRTFSQIDLMSDCYNLLWVLPLVITIKQVMCYHVHHTHTHVHAHNTHNIHTHTHTHTHTLGIWMGRYSTLSYYTGIVRKNKLQLVQHNYIVMYIHGFALVIMMSVKFLLP